MPDVIHELEAAAKKVATPYLVPLRIAAAIAGVVVLVIVLASVGGKLGFKWDPLNRMGRLETKVDEQAGQIAGAAAQAKGAEAAQRITERSIERTETTRIIHEENADAIRTAPGADVLLDPGFVDTVNRGLCRYASTPAAACREVRQAGPAELPQTP